MVLEEPRRHAEAFAALKLKLIWNNMAFNIRALQGTIFSKDET